MCKGWGAVAFALRWRVVRLRYTPSKRVGVCVVVSEVEGRRAWGVEGKAKWGEDQILVAFETDSTTTSEGSGSSKEEEAGSRRAAAAAAAAEQAFEESRQVESMKLACVHE